jgi:hypothetical protein
VKQAFFTNLHAVCHLFATVGLAWNDEVDMIDLSQLVSRSKSVRLKGFVIAGCLGLVFGATSASAADNAGKPPVRAGVLQKLLDCRAISNPNDRLACFEAQTAIIDEAEAKRDVVIIDRDQATKARKEGFGLPIKALVLGKSAPTDEGITDVTSTLRDARTLKDGKWLFILENGARWVQTESNIIRDPKPGHSIRIRKAALGGYIANINGRTAIRVRRIDQPKP